MILKTMAIKERIKDSGYIVSSIKRLCEKENNPLCSNNHFFY